MSDTFTFCVPEWTCQVSAFVEDVSELLIYTVPPAICLVLWKVFVTNRRTRGDISFLGLDDSSSTYSPVFEAGISRWNLLLYLLTGVLTFFAGVLAFETVHALS